MKRAQLITFIKQESRVSASSNLDALIGLLLNQVLVDVCNKSRYWELLKMDTAITLVAAQGSYSLPTDFQNLERVRYSRGSTPFFQTLRPWTSNNRRNGRSGLPEFYLLSSGPKINLIPFADVLVADQLLIDYYQSSLTNFAADSDEFPVPRIESLVQKEVVKRLQGYHSDDRREASTNQEAQDSFIAARSAN